MRFNSSHRLIVEFAALAVAVVFLAAARADAYEISPRSNVHEKMTQMAFECLLNAEKGRRPLRCENKDLESYKPDIRDMSMNFGIARNGVVMSSELERAVSWPDDPTREIGVWTGVKLLVKLLHSCQNRYSGGLKDGLLCSSHYGPMQFWHSMAIPDDKMATVTEQKMLGWAEFLYETATNERILSLEFCDEYWRGVEPDSGKAAIREIFYKPTEFPCKKKNRPWKVSTLFSFKCDRPFSSVKCKSSSDPRKAQLNAIGAMLHLIQDSFSQSHAVRGTPPPKVKKIEAVYECLPITGFYIYQNQNRSRHGHADKFPVAGTSCKGESASVDDPITTSATVMWIIREKKGPAELRRYLSERVFRVEPVYENVTGTYFDKR